MKPCPPPIPCDGMRFDPNAGRRWSARHPMSPAEACAVTFMLGVCAFVGGGAGFVLGWVIWG